MKNTPDEFEKHLKKTLNNTGVEPDEQAVWDNIYGQQRIKNRWLKTKYYGLRLAPVCILLIAGIWWSQQHVTLGIDSQYQVQNTSAPTANIPETTPETATEIRQAGQEALTNGAQKSGISGVNKVPYAQQSFLAEEGLFYENKKTGTKIRIPANALVHQNGSPVKGLVALKFREYRDMATFAASGVPMHYIDDRGEFLFNSGGMFDANVLQGDEQLMMAPGKSYDVAFTPTHELTEPSLYYLNESTGKWEYETVQPFGASSGQPKEMAERTVIRDNRGGKGLECLPERRYNNYQITMGNLINRGVKTGYDLASKGQKLPRWFTENLEISADRMLDGTEVGNILIQRHVDQQELFFPDDLNKKFTELNALKDCYFRLSSDQFSGTLLSPNGKINDLSGSWERISIVQEKDMRCYVSLFGKKGLIQFYADLQPANITGTFDADKVMNEYRSLREERQKGFFKMIEGWRCFLFCAQMFQEQNEWCMTDEQWIVYFYNNLPAMTTRYSDLKDAGLDNDEVLAEKRFEEWDDRVLDLYNKYGTTARVASSNLSKSLPIYTLQLARFGTFNCDQIFRLRSGEYVDTQYFDIDGNAILAKQVCIIEKSSKLFFTLPKPSSLFCSPIRSFDVLVSSAQGRYYLVKGFKANTNKEKNQTLVLHDVTESARTPQDWATLLEL